MKMKEFLEKQREYERTIWSQKNKKIRQIRELREKSGEKIKEELKELEKQELEEREIVGKMIDKINETLD